MMSGLHGCSGRTLAVLAVCLVPLLPANGTEAAGLFVSGASHVLLSDYGPGLGAALDLEFDGGIRLGDAVAFGLEASFAFPLPTGERTATSDVVMRFNPVAWLILGQREWWSYVKVGVGWGGQVEDGDFMQAGLASGAIGVAIAPSTLYVHFGFELAGHIEFTGSRTTRAIGLGGFMGYSF